MSGWSSGLTVEVIELPNVPPNTPQKPSGPAVRGKNQNGVYSTSAIDINDDNVQYRFDWDADGSGDISTWTSLGSNGHTGLKSHSWSAIGFYVVKAQAKDEHGEMSGWSSGRTVEIKVTQQNDAPNIPEVPSGQSVLNIGELGTYFTKATDPDNDDVQYRFDWDALGAGDLSTWTSLGPSNHVGSLTNSWSSMGVYYVKAQARDEHGAIGAWSNSFIVMVGLGSNNAPSQPQLKPRVCIVQASM